MKRDNLDREINDRLEFCICVREYLEIHGKDLKELFARVMEMFCLRILS